jgi:cardiolipin synthase A/B
VTLTAAILCTVVVMLVITVLLNNLLPSERKITQRVPHRYPVRSEQFVRSIGQLLGPPLVAGNHLDALRNGDEIFPAMLAGIRRARETITFETYIWRSGRVAQQFAQALAERARAGVKVHVLFDAVGCTGAKGEEIAQLREAGVEVAIYHLSNVARFNFRTHRKLLVIDGREGFIGGAGIGDEWLGNAASPAEWRDTHYRVAGPVVAQLQAAFNDNWMKAQAEVLDGPEYFPAVSEAGEVFGQVFKSSPQEGSESARLMFLLSIAAATESIHISNAYFLPDDLTVQILLEARARGVRIEIIVPNDHNDSRLVRRAARARYRRLLQAGVRIWEYQPTMLHVKGMVIDRIWSTVGSSNFDNRSFRLNDEANLNVLDEAFADRELRDFAADRARSSEVTWAQWLARPWTEKWLDRVACLFRSQL